MDVMSYYGLVVALARRSHQRLSSAGADIELEDLIQEASLGLLAAARRFDPDRGVDFSTFAYPRIRGAIEDYLRRLDPLTQQQRRKVRDLGEARRRLGQTLGHEPDHHDMAAELGSEGGVDQAAQLADLAREALAPVDSIDELTAGEDSEPGTDSERKALGVHVEECLQQAVTTVERRTILLRLWRRLTLERVGQLLGRPLQTIHNIEKRARQKLRQCLEQKGWEVSDVLEVL